MIYFWLIAALMMVIALAFLLPPLLGRSRHTTVSRKALNLAIFNERLAELEQDRQEGRIDAEEFSQGRNEIERELIYDLDITTDSAATKHKTGRVSAVMVGILVPLLTVLLYLQFGSREVLQASPHAMAGRGNAQESGANPRLQPGQETPSLEEVVASLAQRLETEPENLQGWIMLGRSYLIMERFTQARDAFASAYELADEDPDVLTRFAESIALTKQGRLAGRPAKLLAKALKIQPEHGNALWLSGLAARQQGDHAATVAYWEKLEGLLNPEEAELLSRQLAEARAELKNTGDGAPLIAPPRQR